MLYTKRRKERRQTHKHHENEAQDSCQAAGGRHAQPLVLPLQVGTVNIVQRGFSDGSTRFDGPSGLTFLQQKEGQTTSSPTDTRRVTSSVRTCRARCEVAFLHQSQEQRLHAYSTYDPFPFACPLFFDRAIGGGYTSRFRRLVDDRSG